MDSFKKSKKTVDYRRWVDNLPRMNEDETALYRAKERIEELEETIQILSALTEWHVFDREDESTWPEVENRSGYFIFSIITLSGKRVYMVSKGFICEIYASIEAWAYLKEYVPQKLTKRKRAKRKRSEQNRIRIASNDQFVRYWRR